MPLLPWSLRQPNARVASLQQTPDLGFDLVVAPLAHPALDHSPFTIEEVLRWPGVVAEGSPDREFVVDRDWIGQPVVANPTLDVMCGIVTEICLAYPVVAALKDGFEVSFVENAVGGNTKEAHDIAVLRMIQAGAVPNTTTAMICEWFRDWASPLAAAARTILPSSLHEMDMLTDRYPRMKAAAGV
jgi:hypothetical protein